MKRKITIWQAVIVCALAVLIAVGVTMVLCGRLNPLYPVYEKLQQVDQVVNKHYLKPEQLEAGSLQDGASAGLLAGIGDRYAAYYSADDYINKQKSDDGHLVGIGIEVYPHTDGSLIVHKVYPSSPAEAAGMIAGDNIISVEDVSLVGLSYSEAMELVRGEEGSVVRLEIRQGEKNVQFEVTRADVVLPSVFLTMIDDIAYVQIDDFNNETEIAFEDVVQEAQKADAKGMIFDLRDNGGGLMNVANSMLDLLLPEGALTTTVDVHGTKTVQHTSDANCVELPMVCLVNGNTASAAELFVATLRDFEYAHSVGTKTYGKGVMQTTYPLEDGSAVKLTTAYFNPPSGENFNGVGIIPDVVLPLTAEQNQSFAKGDRTQDPQLEKALAMLS